MWFSISELRDLAAHPVEGREHDCRRRVVDDEVHPRDALERADVAPLAPDDATLHVVGGQLDDRHRGLRRVAGREALHRGREDVPRPPRGVAAGLLLELADRPGDVVARLPLELAHQRLLGLDTRQPGDILQGAQVLVPGALELLGAALEAQVALVEGALARVDLRQPALERLLALQDPLLEAADLGAPLGQLVLQALPEPDQLLSGVAGGRCSGRLRRGLLVRLPVLAALPPRRRPRLSRVDVAARPPGARRLRKSLVGGLQAVPPPHRPGDGSRDRRGTARYQDLHDRVSPGPRAAARSPVTRTGPFSRCSFVRVGKTSKPSSTLGFVRPRR
jgi:hypothetical protein